jgi:lysophospholipid acyltransferase (LPLAT)-like uncharacterized protein
MVATVLPALLSWLSSTWRTRREVHPEALPYVEAGRPAIYALWHAQMFCLLRGFPEHWRRERLAILVSPSRDGDFITSVVRRLGFAHFIRGSQKRAGMRAGRQVIRALHENQQSVAFLVDGPRGPRHCVKPGVLRLAAQARVPIIPMAAVSPYRLWELPSWDRFQAPLMWTPFDVRFGAPVHFQLSSTETEAGLSEAASQLANVLHQLGQANSTATTSAK